MRIFIAGAAVAALLVGSAHATPQDDAAAPVAAFIGAFDKGDMKTATAQFEDSVTIIHEVAPYVWTGPKGLRSPAHTPIASAAPPLPTAPSAPPPPPTPLHP